MPLTITPRSVADMDPNFEGRLRDLKEHAKEQSVALGKTEQRRIFVPRTWDGDPFSYETMSKPFERTKANEDLVKAISRQESPGTTGDVVACSTMINQLSVMERSFRVRHTLRRCRGSAHALGRTTGHGSDSGPFIQLGVEYVRALLRQAKKV